MLVINWGYGELEDKQFYGIFTVPENEGCILTNLISGLCNRIRLYCFKQIQKLTHSSGIPCKRMLDREQAKL